MQLTANIEDLGMGDIPDPELQRNQEYSVCITPRWRGVSSLRTASVISHL
jgi:hypothetical protein